MTLDHDIRSALHRIEKKLDCLLRKEIDLMATIDEFLASVTAEDDAEDAATLALEGENDILKKSLAEALAKTITPEVQAKIDAAFAASEARRAKLAAAVVANTPAAPPVP